MNCPFMFSVSTRSLLAKSSQKRIPTRNHQYKFCVYFENWNCIYIYTYIYIYIYIYKVSVKWYQIIVQPACARCNIILRGSLLCCLWYAKFPPFGWGFCAWFRIKNLQHFMPTTKCPIIKNSTFWTWQAVLNCICINGGILNFCLF